MLYIVRVELLATVSRQLMREGIINTLPEFSSVVSLLRQTHTLGITVKTRNNQQAAHLNTKTDSDRELTPLPDAILFTL